MGFAKRLGREEKGIVESTLVIIPLLALFLITVGLVVAVNYRNIDMTFAQSAASTGAITSVISEKDEIITFTTRDSGKALRLVITHRQRLLPRLIPNLPFLKSVSDRTTDVVGISVMEEQP